MVDAKLTAAEQPGAQEFVPRSPDLHALREAAEHCRGCELWRGATRVVFSAGASGARLFFVGEQPGDKEDLAGEPFVGPAGRVFDEALAAAGIDRADVYVTNAVKHFRYRLEPRGKRRIHEKPATTHIVACHPWLEAELAIVRPRLVVCLGATAARSVLGRPARIQAERGKVIRLDRDDADTFPPVLITTHPSALLRVRGKPGWDEAFDAFVVDFETAAQASRSAA